MLIDFNSYNDSISSRRGFEQKAAKSFAQIAQLIEPGNCFFVAINGYADEYNVGYLDRKVMDQYYVGEPVTLKFIQVVDITNVGVDCLIATVEGIWDNIESNIQIYNITWNREIYPSFVDILYLKWEIYQFDGSTIGWSDAELMYDRVRMYQDFMQSQTGDVNGKQTRGGIKGNTEGVEPTHFDVSIYTGNDVEISSQFENYKEHPDDENPDDPEKPEDSEPENTEDPEPEDPKGSGDQR